ncbi:MAG TPA: DUF2147 domain-containing protein [Chlamydiales bacterium]|nr:DUF2147 domain-containing protein [Chlamydiales bacterium]
MNKKYFICLLVFLGISFSAMAEEIKGFWMTRDKETHLPSSIIAIYPYNGKYYGRIIATYDKQGVLNDTIYKPLDRAPGLAGQPFYSGLDIVWSDPPAKEGKEGKKAKRYKGQIVNPNNGKVYTAKLWRDNENLILRGEVLCFGKNVTWYPFPDDKFTEDFKKPDLSTFVPKIPIKLD